jgi:predicted ATPase/DNA-binding winged helix-turn-helix (wHTH) protein
MQSSTSATIAAPAPRAAHAVEHAPDDVITFGPFRLRPSERLIERSGQPVKLGGRALDILITLVDRAGEVVSQRELIDRVWPNVTVDDGNLRFHVSGLRKALGDGDADARHVINVTGRGYCFVGPVIRTPAGHSAPPATPPANAVCGLPARLNRMVGRDAEVAALAEQVRTQRFVTVLGPGGIGKTTVAVAVGHALAAEYGLVGFVDFSPVGDPRLVPRAIATALGLAVEPDELAVRLIAGLAGRRTLLVMDSCDHVIETAAEWAETIFAQVDDVSILATSREALRIEGEHVCRLAPLACPPLDDAVSSAEVLAFPAAQLLADRIGRASERFALPDSDAPIVARICAKLDGIPLAIELAAGRVEAHGLHGVEALLDSRLNLLWQGRRTAPPRHQTLNATFDWSFDLLAEPERTVLRRLSVLAGGFTLEEAQIAARDTSADVDLITEALASLVAKSLVMSDTQDGRRRYRLLDTTRAYLHAKAASAAQP